MAAKNKKQTKNKFASKDYNKSVKNKHLVPYAIISLVVLVLALIFTLNSGKDKVSVKDVNEFEAYAQSCSDYALNSLRANFCAYKLMNGKLMNCREPSVIDKLNSKGVDTTLNSLNCKNIDNYSFRKTACQLLAPGNPDMVIADSTCNNYR